MRRLNRGIRALARFALLTLSVASAGEPAEAQVPWETPQLLAPHSPPGLGISFADYGTLPGDGWGLLLTWRPTPAPGFGFRATAARGSGENIAGAAGIDVSTWIVRASADFPLDVIWTSGAGVGYGEYVQVGVPMGFSAGRAVGSGNLWVNPYISARAVVEGRWGDAAPADAVDLGLATDLGADVAFDRRRLFILRFAASFGDRNALVVGAHLRAGPAPRPAISDAGG